MLRVCLFLCLSLPIVFLACSNEKSDSQNSQDSKKEFFYFENKKTNQKLKIELDKQDSPLYPLNILLQVTKNSADEILFSNKAILLVIFPAECSLCLPVLTHLNNLALRFQSLQVIVLSTSYINAKLYQDLLASKDSLFRLFINNESILFSLLDSLKRELNIEIKDSKSPFFLLVDQDKRAIRSYEGPILEEILDNDITNLLIASKAVKEKIKSEQERPAPQEQEK